MSLSDEKPRPQMSSIDNMSTVHPRLSEKVELKFLLGRSDTQNIRIIEEEHFTY